MLGRQRPRGAGSASRPWKNSMSPVEKNRKCLTCDWDARPGLSPQDALDEARVMLEAKAEQDPYTIGTVAQFVQRNLKQAMRAVRLRCVVCQAGLVRHLRGGG